MPNAIKIQEGTASVLSGQTFRYAGIPEAVDRSRAFVVMAANRHTTGGSIASTGNHEADDLGVTAEITGVQEIEFRRVTTSTETLRVQWQVWEYVGPVGGENEFLLRDTHLVDTSGGGTFNTTIADVVDPDRCIPFVSGYLSNDTGNGADTLASSTYLTSATNLRTIHPTTSTTSMMVQIVEFTGSAWSVGHARANGANGDIVELDMVEGADGVSGAAFTVPSWSQAAIASWSHSGDDVNEAIEDHFPKLTPGSTTGKVQYKFMAGHPDMADEVVVIHVLAHAGLSVNRYEDTANGDQYTNIDITSAGLTDLTAAAVLGTSISTGSGTAYARGWRTYQIDSLIRATHWCHRSGNGMEHNLQIIDFAGVQYTVAGGDVVEVWDGASWVSATVEVWDGAAWLGTQVTISV